MYLFILYAYYFFTFIKFCIQLLLISTGLPVIYHFSLAFASVNHLYRQTSTAHLCFLPWQLWCYFYLKRNKWNICSISNQNKVWRLNKTNKFVPRITCWY